MAEEFVLNYVTGEGSPEGSYRELGVEPTGEEISSEVAMGLRVTDPAFGKVSGTNIPEVCTLTLRQAPSPPQPRT